MAKKILSGEALVLDPEQHQVVNHVRGPARVLGVAGSGKTEALIAAVMARLAEFEQVNGSSRVATSELEQKKPVLVLAFDKNAAIDLREEFAKRISSGEMPVVTTFHALAWTVVSQYTQTLGAEHSLQLLSGSEQDPRIRELLKWAVAEGNLKLPAGFDHALGTLGLAEEVRRLFAKAQQLGISPTELDRIGQEFGIDEWRSLSSFFANYIDATAAEGGIDYAAVLPTAATLLSQNLSDDQFCYSAIYVDEYHDVEPAQVELIRQLSVRSPNIPLVVFGSPDEMIFRFRGASPAALQEFERDFAQVSSCPSVTVVLGHQYRLAPPIAVAAQTIVQRIPLAGYPALAQRALRWQDQLQELVADSPTTDSNWLAQEVSSVGMKRVSPRVELSSFLTATAQYNQVAESIRRLKLSGQVAAWSEIAVITRSASAGFSLLQQTLVASGIPVVSLGAGSVLRDEPGVRDLLLVLRALINPDQLTKQSARSIALSPLGGLTPSEYRSLARKIRDQKIAAGVKPKSAASAFREVLLDPVACAEVSGPGAQKLLQLSRLLARVAHLVNREQAYQVVWQLWDGSGWPADLRRLALSQSSQARSANRTLDAVVALFELIRRSERVSGIPMSVNMLLVELENQGFSAHQGADSERDGVRLLNAHSAKGKKWSVVFIVDLQEGNWPRISQQVSLLRTDQLARGDLVEPISVLDQIRDERRLLYVSISRATERVFVFCIADQVASRSSVQPSRFFDELVAVARQHPTLGFLVVVNSGLPARGLSTSSLVAQLRHTLESPDSSVALKAGAANRLAILASEGIRAADPATWWGTREWSNSATPVFDPAKPVRVSGSSWQNLDSCALKWFLSHEAGGETARGTATAFGSVVHALADAVAKGEVKPDISELRTQLESVWGQLGFAASWQEEQEKDDAVNALNRFLVWQDPAQRDRRLIATETSFEAVVQSDSDSGVLRNSASDISMQAQIVGFADRLEQASDGSVVVVDLKNQKTPPTGTEVTKHKQLWLYQLAVMVGAFDGQLADSIPATCGGAELVQLRVQLKPPDPKIQSQDPVSLAELQAALAKVVRLLRSEEFAANPKSGLCSYCDFKLICPAWSLSTEVVN